MGKNIRSQIFYGLDKSYAPGTGKKEYTSKWKSEGNTGPADKIFSRGELNDLKDLAKNFSGFLKTRFEYKDIKQWKDIPSSAYQDFLNEKALNCTKDTLIRYHSNFKKMESCLNNRFQAGVDIMGDVVTPNSLKGNNGVRDIAMDPKDLDKIKEVAYSTKRGQDSRSIIGLELAIKYRLRVESVCNMQIRDIDLKNGTVTVYKDKNEKTRVLPMQVEDVKFLKDTIAKAEAAGSKKLCQGLKPNSLNRAIARWEVKAGCRKKYGDAKTSVHAIRKMGAQQLYDKYRKTHTKRETLEYVSIYLGHGGGRFENDWDETKTYLSNIY